MIRKITSLLLALASVCVAYASTTYDLIGTTYKVDTLFHAQIGPGTTQTSLMFTGPTYNLRVFYTTTDLTNPNISVHAVCATDKVAGTEKPSSMAVRKSKDGLTYFAGVNADFFYTKGTTTRGESMVGTPDYACIVNGEFYKTSNANKQFAIDVNGVPYVGQANFYTGTATTGTKSVLFRGVNVNAPNNAVTIYTSRYHAGTNQAAGCAEVTAKLVEGDSLVPGKTCRMEVTSLPSTAGDTSIPAGGFVINGKGTTVATGTTVSAFEFVDSLKVGDIVAFNSVVTMDGTTIVPHQMISGNPRIVGDGATLDTESLRTDASTFQPRSAIGYGAGKTKLIMMVVDGRSSISNGVRTSQLGDLMRYAGASDAINIDGGGSSVLYTLPLGVRNVPSDGSERPVGNAIFVVSSAPADDNVITSIRFKDWAMNFPKYGIYKPVFYGYNASGMLINPDVKGVKLSCPAALGHISADSIFVGDGEGCYALSAALGNITTSIPVTITPAEKISMRLDSVVNDTFRPYAVEVLGTMGDEQLSLDPAALTWSSQDESIVKIDAQNGVLMGVADGSAMVQGSVGSYSGQLKVLVQKPTAHAMTVDANPDLSTWKITQTGGTGITASALGSGFKVAYTGNGVARGAYIKLSKALTLWSLPDTIRVKINPHSAPVKSITFATRPAGGSLGYAAVQPQEAITADKEAVFVLPVDKCFDTSDMKNFPMTLEYLQMSMGTSSSGTPYEIDVNSIETLYSAIPTTSGISQTKLGDMRLLNNPVRSGESAFISLSRPVGATIGIYDLGGRCLKTLQVPAGITTASIPLGDISSGYYLLRMSQQGLSSTLRLIVK